MSIVGMAADSIIAAPGMVPVDVTAHLGSALVTGHRWGISLDGLLASQLWAELIETTDPDQVPWPSTTDTPPDLELPLARCTQGGDLWHWAATCSQPEAAARDSVGYRYRPTPGHLLETTTRRMPGTIAPGTPLARREIPHLAHTSHTLHWRCVGDPDRIHDLLAHIPAIGKGRQHGEGAILEWQITPAPHANPWAYAHLHADNTLGRTCPPPCLPHGLAAAHPPILAGLRPPAMHPARQHLLCTP